MFGVKLIKVLLTPLLNYLGFRKTVGTNFGLPESHYYANNSSFKDFSSIHFHYLRSSGWIESKNVNRPIRNGQYIPWITYGALNFLESINLSELNVVEIGSGASTFYFYQKVRNLISYEFDSEYLSIVKSLLGKGISFKSLSDHEYLASKDCLLDENYLEILKYEISKGNFQQEWLSNRNVEAFTNELKNDISGSDLLFIDGGPRLFASKIASLYSKEDCLIILDNTETKYGNLCLSTFKESGYLQIPFRGLGPLNPNETETSILFKNLDALKNKF